MTDRSQNPIDKIFDRLSGVYGRRFLDLYAGIPMADVKAAWARELAGYANYEGMIAIGWALANLPEQVPDAVRFRNLCRSAPGIQHQRLKDPDADPQRVAAELERLQKVRAEVVGQFGVDAYARLAERAAKGERLNLTQRQMLEAARGRRS